MPPDRPFSHEDVERLVARWSGNTGWCVAPATEGVSTPVYRLARGPEVRYLRLAEAPGESRIAERRVHDLLHAAGVRVPRVVWFDPSAPEVNRSAMITTAIAGGPLYTVEDEADGRAVVRRAGPDLATINAIPVHGYGWLTGVDAGGRLLAEHPDRAAWTAEYRAAAEEVADRASLDGLLLIDLMAEWATMPEQHGAHLAHGDLDTSHIYCQDSAYTGIIDLGEIRGADRAYDLGHFLLHDGERCLVPLLPALLDGYRAALPSAGITRRDIALQAVAIGTRALARMLRRPATPYAPFLTTRLSLLLGELSG